MELAKIKACICEGAAEAAIIDVLLDNDQLILSGRKCWMKVSSAAEMGKPLRQDI